MSGHLVARLGLTRGEFRFDAALEVPDGAVVALMGRNGAGKSTAVAAMAGLVPLQEGRIEVDGVVLDDPDEDVLVSAERRPIGVVQQQAALFPHLSVLDNVAFGLRSPGPHGPGLSHTAARRRARELLEEAGLDEFAARRPSSLSGGQAARVALARTLARRPSLLLMDEPLAAIDAELRPQLRIVIADALRGFAGSALLVTHDVRDAEALADSVVVLDAGRVVQQGSLAALRAAPAAPIVASLLAGGD